VASDRRGIRSCVGPGLRRRPRRGRYSDRSNFLHYYSQRIIVGPPVASHMLRVGVNGFGTIGKRVADAVRAQPDMRVAGVAKCSPNYEAAVAADRGYALYAAGADGSGPVPAAGFPFAFVPNEVSHSRQGSPSSWKSSMWILFPPSSLCQSYPVDEYRK